MGPGHAVDSALADRTGPHPRDVSGGAAVCDLERVPSRSVRDRVPPGVPRAERCLAGGRPRGRRHGRRIARDVVMTEALDTMTTTQVPPADASDDCYRCGYALHTIPDDQ